MRVSSPAGKRIISLCSPRNAKGLLLLKSSRFGPPQPEKVEGRKKKGGKGPEADLSCDDRFLPGFIHRGRAGDLGGRFPVGSCLGLCTKASGKAQMSIDTFVYQRNIQRYFFCFFSCRISGSVRSILCRFRLFCRSGKQQCCLAGGEGRGLR